MVVDVVLVEVASLFFLQSRLLVQLAQGSGQLFLKQGHVPLLERQELHRFSAFLLRRFIRVNVLIIFVITLGRHQVNGKL